MNILHLSATKNWGGGENHIENLCKELLLLAPEVTNTIFCTQNGLFQKKLSEGNLKVIPAKLAFKMDPRFIFKLIRVCRNKKIDLIHIHDTTALTLAVMGDRLYDLPPFIFSKKTSFPIKSRERTLYKYNYPKIKKFLCVSKATQQVTGLSVTDKFKLNCIYHGMDTNPGKNSHPLNLREKSGLGENTIIIGNIANHIRAKSLTTFVLVAKELVITRGIENLHFVQIGAFSSRTPKLKSMVKELKLEDHITFFDHLSEASAIIPQFDISLMTSQSEGMPQFIYESLFHRVPVVSTDVGGISEVIQHKKNGLLAPAHDHIALADHIQTLIEEPGVGKKLTQNSRETIEENFTSEKMASKTLEVYKEIINGRS